MKPRPASQRAMAAKPTQKQLRAAFASQAPHDVILNSLVDDTRLSFLPMLDIPAKKKRRKIDGNDSIDDLGEK